MINYIKADLKRILTSLSFWFWVLLIYGTLVVSLAVLCFMDSDNWNSVMFTSAMMVASGMLTLFLGLVVQGNVYAGDFKAKTMQVAIGTGLSRRGVVLSKFTEVAVLTGGILIPFVIIGFGAGKILGVEMTAEQTLEVVKYFPMTWIRIIGLSSIAMILFFFTQSVGPATLVYIVLAMEFDDSLITLVNSKIPVIAGLHLNRFTFLSCVKLFQSRFILGSFHLKSFLGILVYIIGCTAATVYLFRKRELEF